EHIGELSLTPHTYLKTGMNTHTHLGETGQGFGLQSRLGRSLVFASVITTSVVSTTPPLCHDDWGRHCFCLHVCVCLCVCVCVCVCVSCGLFSGCVCVSCSLCSVCV